ncbi:MAG: alkaline phosphatase family protein [Clostridia bacterium]|nr:alkaline phosphatase family protein [Clostridia bacterium]
MALQYPEYDRSLLSLTSSVLNYYGAESQYSTLPEVDILLEKRPKNVVVMLFDGLGTYNLEIGLPAGSFLRQHLISSVSSVFPATTTAATITMQTGLPPISHGWLGWDLYFREVDSVVSVFPNTVAETGGKQAAPYHLGNRHLATVSITEKIRLATQGRICAKMLSPYGTPRYESLEKICSEILRLCGTEKENYIYAYWPQPDYDMHDHGVSAEAIKAQIAEIDSTVETLCRNLKDTLVLVTADHGLIDVQWRFLSDYPALCECIRRRPAIDARALTFWVKQGMNDRFESLFQQAFGDCYHLFSREEVLRHALFGVGKAHPLTDDFIGDYVAAAYSNIGIEVGKKTQDMFRAAHAGMTREEMTVPMIAVECGV